MTLFLRGVWLLGCAFLGVSCGDSPSSEKGNVFLSKDESYSLTGIVRQIKPESGTAIISHEEVPNYMAAMTMPFKVRDAKILATLQTNAVISFRLSIQNEESWIDRIVVLTNALSSLKLAETADKPESKQPSANSDLFTFTNEFGRAVSLTDFKGQPLALTFFFTRCPVPDYCPRLSRNFQEASEKLAASPHPPTNWHFLSITIDPEHDNPAALKRYAETYNYDSNHWSFLTGPKDRIENLTRSFGFEYQADGAFFNHSFRTVIIDISNRVQQVFPFSGNFSEEIVKEMKKASGQSPLPAK